MAKIKFITEEYLRNIYRKKPFDTYELEEGQRLTPGGAQYLSDKRIKITGNVLNENKTNFKVNKNSSKIDENNFEEKKPEIEKKVEKVELGFNLNKKLCYKLKSIEALCLVTSSEVLKEDVFLAQNIIEIRKKISNIRSVVSGKGILMVLNCRECTGINSKNFTTEIDDCFEITEFHMQLKNSNIILKMHTLRCELQELQFEFIENYKNDDLKDKILENMNAIINSLSQLICSAVGGKQCQRKE